MEHIKYTNEDSRFRRTMAAMAVALLLFYMLCPAAPERWNDLYMSYGRPLIIAMAAIYFYKCRFSGCVEVKTVILYTLWLFITRLLNTDYYLQNEFELVIGRVLCCVMLPVGLLLERHERERLLDFVIAIAGGFFFISALLGLYTCIFGVYLYIPPENVVFGIDGDTWFNAFSYVVAWGTNRTIAALWFYLGWCMMAYEFFHCKNKLWRIPIVLAWFVFHMTLAFCFCRSLMLVVCINVAMISILLGIRYIRTKNRALKTLLVVLLCLVSLPISYKSFDVIRSGSAAIYNSLDIGIERTSDQHMTDGHKERTEDGQTFEDPRDLKQSVSNVSQRGEIYASVIPTFKQDPMRLLIGKYSSKLMDIPNLYQSYPYFHMHNYLLQVLMLTGIVGFVLVLAFTVLMVVKMIRLFFSDHPDASLAVKTLTLPLSGVFVYGMFEIILFTSSADERAVVDFRELFFLLIAGIFLGFYYEIFPEKNKAK